MSLSELFDRLEHKRRTGTVYASPPQPDLKKRLDVNGVAVTFCPLPEETTQSFLVVRDEDGFVEAIDLEAVSEFLDPPTYRPWDEELADAPYRSVLEALDTTVWRALDRRQLLATAREIEERAWRVGRGTLRVGFQRLSAMESQLPIYERLGTETALEIHVYGRDDWEPPDIPGVTIHTDSDGEIGRFWVLAFDGGPDDERACGLLAEERKDGGDGREDGNDRREDGNDGRGEGEFTGFWTYDADLVDEIDRETREAVN